MKNRDQMTRICSSCGLQKPLSAFLQITAQGTVYGAICAACRSKGAREKAKKSLLEEEKSSTTNAGARIGTKQKVDIEREKARLLREAKELEIEEAQKRDELTNEKEERTSQRERGEKAHRADIEERQRKLATQKKSSTSQSLIGQKMVNDRAGTAYVNERQQAEQAKKTDDAIKQDVRTNTVDLTGNVRHNTTGVDTPAFRTFLSWLGNDAPLVKAMDRMFKKTPTATQAATPPAKPVAAEKPSFSAASAKQTTFSAKQSGQEKKPVEQKQDEVKKFIRSTWGKS